jgi:DNA-binding response OmpR family regulator
VLIVDDNIDAADSLCALLTISGHTAKTVYRGADALLELPRFKPDVVLLDITTLTRVLGNTSQLS